MRLWAATDAGSVAELETNRMFDLIFNSHSRMSNYTVQLVAVERSLRSLVHLHCRLLESRSTPSCGSIGAQSLHRPANEWNIFWKLKISAVITVQRYRDGLHEKSCGGRKVTRHGSVHLLELSGSSTVCCFCWCEETSFLSQRISVAIQRFNFVLLHGPFVEDIQSNGHPLDFNL